MDMKKSMTNQTLKSSIEELYQMYWETHIAAMEQGHSPLEIAATIISQGLVLYKTTLSDKDYHSMVDNISNLRDSVKQLNFDQRRLH